MERLNKYYLAQLHHVELLQVKKITKMHPDAFYEDEVKFVDELLEYHNRETVSADLCIMYLAKTVHKTLRQATLN